MKFHETSNEAAIATVWRRLMVICNKELRFGLGLGDRLPLVFPENAAWLCSPCGRLTASSLHLASWQIWNLENLDRRQKTRIFRADVSLCWFFV